MRISLQDYEVINNSCCLQDIVEKFKQSFTFNECSISFPARTDKWNIHLVRHKRERIFIQDRKYALTVVDVKEHKFYENYNQKQRTIQLELSEDDTFHSEVEVSWRA